MAPTPLDDRLYYAGYYNGKDYEVLDHWIIDDVDRRIPPIAERSVRFQLEKLKLIEGQTDSYRFLPVTDDINPEEVYVQKY